MKSSTGQTLKVQGTDLRRHAESTLRKEQKTKIKNNSQSLNSFLHIDESFCLLMMFQAILISNE